ncbi:MAG TPA: hypothetical protein VHS78_09925 [Candidatus Elarobacter sp.]|jgi:hypothetical protein|nr:hypothetical protein [Candidatus Elarobacter sp.]
MPNRSARLARRFFISFALTFAGCALACGCGGGGGGPASPAFVAPSPTPTPSPTAPPGGPVTLSSTSANLTLAGQTTTVTASETGYAGQISADAGTCANVASVSPSAASAPATFTITARGSGSCTVTFADAFGQRAPLSVGVTVTQGNLQ